MDIPILSVDQPQRPARSHRPGWFPWTAVALAAGILIYFDREEEPGAAWIAGLAALSVGGWLIGYRLFIRDQAILAVSGQLSLAIAWMSLGFVLAAIRTDRVATPILRDDPQTWRTIRLQGHVARARLTDKGLRFIIEAPRLEGIALPPRRIRLLWRGQDAKAALPSEWVGSSITALTLLRPPPEAVAPDAYDFRRAAWFEGIGASGVILGSPYQLDLETPDLITQLARHRLRIAEALRVNLSGNVGALAAALLTGERGLLTMEVVHHFRATGLSHLLAISGLHVGMVIGGIFFALQAVIAVLSWLTRLQIDSRRWAAAGALVAALGYLWLSGASLPTQRATLAGSLALLALMLRRDPCSLRLVALCAIVLLVWRPESVLQAGFQMSFMAVIALVSAYEALKAYQRPVGPLARLLRPIGLLVLTSLIAGGATAPFAAFHFHRLAHYSIIANLAAVPLMSLWIMPWGLSALILMPIGLEDLALKPMALGIHILLAIARSIAAWPEATSSIPAAPPEVLLIISSALLLLCLCQHRSRWLGVLVILLGIGLWYHTQPPLILVGRDAKLFAIAAPDGGLVMPEGKASYTRRVWERRYGLSAGSQDIIHCDPIGCIAHLPGGRLAAFPRDPSALIDDCRRADIVIAAMDLPPSCGRKLALDNNALIQGGAHAIFPDGDHYRIKAARQQTRPWHLPQ